MGWFSDDEHMDASALDEADLDEDFSQSGALRGRLYWADGRRVERPLGLIATSRGWVRAFEQHGQCDPKGEFEIPISDGKQMHRADLALTVEGMPVAPQRVSQALDGALVVILPAELGRGNDSACGGIVTGVVLDSDGAGLEQRSVGGEVRTEGFLSFMSSAEVLPAKTISRGRFALEFTGGLALKRIYVDGGDPDEIYLERRGEKLPLSGDIRAGTYGLRLVRGKRILGIF